MKPNSILVMSGICKTFPGVKALDDVQMDVKAGEIHALLGENGAGKSTLMKILSGVYKPDSGSIQLENKTVDFESTKEAEKAGIGIIYQELNLIPHMTVAENIFLGREPRSRWFTIDRRKMRARATDELKRLDTPINPKALVDDLRIGEQQLVEIAKALSLQARIVIMDEPTSALSDAEVEKLFSIIRNLKRKGVAVIYISHKLEEIFAVADRVTVLRDGKYIGTKKVKETTSADLINMMVGRDLEDLFPKQIVPIGREILRLENLTIRDPEHTDRYILKEISFSLHRGEILGIAGLMGAGRTELMMSLFGVPPGEKTAGALYIDGEKKDITSPTRAIEHGLALVTEDRKSQGLFLQLPVYTNISIASLKRVIKYKMLRRRLENRLVREYVEKLRIKIPEIATLVETLSGGNQQKVILAKWLLTHPAVLLLDDPTRGIDVGAKAEIYQLMNEFIRQGMGIIMVSSELPEILAMSDRVIVLSQGRLTGEFSRKEATEEKIMTAATHSDKQQTAAAS
jgi:ribose transport system ATP-binding protein